MPHSVVQARTLRSTWAVLLSRILRLTMVPIFNFGCFRLAHGPEEVMVPMRDGVKLHTRIWRSAEEGKHPVVLTRGYSPGSERDAKKFNAAGYVYVGQSTRGHAASQGAHGAANRFFDDIEDGYDALTWISNQPWCDGQVAMYGKSYWGATQWLVAPKQHPNLKAIIPQVVATDAWKSGYRRNGVLTLAMTARGRAYEKKDWNRIDRIGWLNYFQHLPVYTLDEVVEGASQMGARKLWKDYVTHSSFDDYWKPITICSDGSDRKYEQIRIPVYLMGGWYDYYPGEAFTSYERLREVGATEEVRIIINPSDHLNQVVGDRDFGRHAEKDEIALATRWLDYVLKGIENGIKDEPPIRVFVMGTNEWRGEYEWPLARTKLTPYYFHSFDGSRTGWLSPDLPEDEVPTAYTYDPKDPVPTLGGNHSFSDTNILHIIRAGAVDQRPNESRRDVLVFTTPPLEEDTEVTGPVVINLYASSSAPDTDFTAKLLDVYPDGSAYNLTEGIIRARFREDLWGAPILLEPGKLYKYSLELLPTSNVFRRGHSIRVHLTSSNFPLWERNLNTGNDPAFDVTMEKAEQTIYHSQRYPSHIVLPIIPR